MARVSVWTRGPFSPSPGDPSPFSVARLLRSEDSRRKTERAGHEEALGGAGIGGVAGEQRSGPAGRDRIAGSDQLCGRWSYGAPDRAPSFGDEFTSRIDPSRWGWDTDRNKAGWYNHELQYYAGPDRSNARIEDGSLVLQARREALKDEPDWGGQAYSSAKLVTRQTLGYGFYEIRAKLPCGRGMWPAIWLLPTGGAPRPAGVRSTSWRWSAGTLM